MNDQYSACFSGCAAKVAKNNNNGVQCLYGQCGGEGYTGPTECEPSTVCTPRDATWSECRPEGYQFPSADGGDDGVVDSSVDQCALVSKQCGGALWTGPTCCQGMAVCLPVRPATPTPAVA